MSSFQQQQNETMKRSRKEWLIHRKKKLTETVSEEAQTLDLIDKDFKFKSILLSVLKELMETRVMSHQTREQQ